MRPFRFGVQVHTAGSHEQWAALARRAEELGYDVICIPDHVGPQLAPFPALAAAAAATSRIRVGTFVLDNDFRHPLLTAHEAVTVHALSGGRLELGLGAGWLRRDYERLGVEFAPPRVRVERLEEAVEIAGLYFRGGELSFDGRHYTVDRVEPRRLPDAMPPPPLLIGGGGPRVIDLAARKAGVASVFFTATRDGSGFEDMLPATYRRKIERLRASAGERDVEVNVLVQTVEVTDDRRAAVERGAREFEMTPEDFLALPFGLAGTVDEIADDLERHRESYGASYFTVRGDVFESFAPVVEKLAGR